MSITAMPVQDKDLKERKRRRKPRTKQVSDLPAIVASELKANEINLTPGKEHTVCPNCGCWTPITGILGTPKLTPHHTTPYHHQQSTPRRCIGSNRRIDLDIDARFWRTQLAETNPTVAARRATKVLPKPKTGTLPAATQLKPVALSASAAHQILLGHIDRCMSCTKRTPSAAARMCRDGARLEELFQRLRRQEPTRRARREVLERERRRFDRQYMTAAVRREHWESVLPRAEAADAQRVPEFVGEQPAEACEAPMDPELVTVPDGRKDDIKRLFPDRPSLVRPTPKCVRCGATKPTLASAAAAGWRRIRHQMHCGPCAIEFPAWTTPFSS
ncbi:hypothetical protein [Streptomyces sp. NPDC051561]|uniref:hypothetical protein n=1 Tax=Streptomyces sp. NPDC051561 TaxID=3365658 RepID=UPI0037B60571